MQKILIVEGDPERSPALDEALTTEGFQVLSAPQHIDLLQRVSNDVPDLIILDSSLTDEHARQCEQQLQDGGITIPLLDLRQPPFANGHRKRRHFRQNGDAPDPPTTEELLALVKDRLNGRNGSSTNSSHEKILYRESQNRFRLGDVLIDLKRYEILKAGELQSVTNKEFRLLEFFIKHPGEVISRARLLDEIWGYRICPITRTVDNHILRLRKHLEPARRRPIYIRTVRGAGYLFDVKIKSVAPEDRSAPES